MLNWHTASWAAWLCGSTRDSKSSRARADFPPWAPPCEVEGREGAAARTGAAAAAAAAGAKAPRGAIGITRRAMAATSRAALERRRLLRLLRLVPPPRPGGPPLLRLGIAAPGPREEPGSSCRPRGQHDRTG
jgi:hypothetical protein